LKGRDRKWLLFVTAGITVILLFTALDAMAETETVSSRKTWDSVMLWVNFGILAFVIVKYARKPLMGHLLGVRSKVENDLSSLENEFAQARALAIAEENKMKEIDQRLSEIQESILQLGRKEREEIIEQGKVLAEKMVRDAQIYAEHQFALAKQALTAQMVDMAIHEVEDRLLKGMTEKDNDSVINQFMIGLSTAKSRI
jgi:F-type H+-transporting ATPase subunit b